MRLTESFSGAICDVVFIVHDMCGTYFASIFRFVVLSRRLNGL